MADLIYLLGVITLSALLMAVGLGAVYVGAHVWEYLRTHKRTKEALEEHRILVIELEEDKRKLLAQLKATSPYRGESPFEVHGGLS